MSSYLNLGSTGQQLISEQLYKTLFGFPDGKVGSSLNLEVAGTSRSFTFQNQVFSQTVPDLAPTLDSLSAPVDITLPVIGVVGQVQTPTDPTISYIKYYSNMVLSNTATSANAWWFIAANPAYSPTRADQIINNKLNKIKC
jgi:hypothetical protein